MKIKDYPLLERPQEKLLRYGVKRLTDDELLAIIIGSGTRKMNALVLAKYIRRNIPLVDFEELKQIQGIGEVKIARILASVELGKRFQQKNLTAILRPKDIWLSLIDIRGSKKEYFIVFYLNIQNQIIQREIISIGTLTSAIVHPREVFEPAIRYLASQIIISHNHPSGFCQPSEEDVDLTNRLVNVSKIVDIDVIDHIIVTESSFFSFKEHKIMD